MPDGKYVLTRSRGNVQEAEVDGIRLSQGGEPVELTDDQLKRLRAAGAKVSEQEAEDYSALSKDDLEKEAASRGLEVEGSGADGNVVKDDLVSALEESDERGEG